jgi:hypothetical protein
MLLCLNVVLSSGEEAESFFSFPMLTWNPLSCGDTFADGWGCPGEKRLLEKLMFKGYELEQAVSALLSAR